MRLRTFLALVSLLGVAAAIVFLLLPNRSLLEQPVRVWNADVPVWGALAGAFGVGLAAALVFQLTGLGRGALASARYLWSARHREAAIRALERGRQAEREQRIDEAIVFYREAVQKAPFEFRAQMLLGDALRRAGRIDEALIAHEEARRLQQRSDEPIHALAHDHLANGQLDKARREFRALVELRPKGAVGPLRQLRDLELRAGNWEAAEQAHQKLEVVAGRASELTDQDRRQGRGIRTELAKLRAKGGHLRGATHLIKKILKDDPSFLPALLAHAEIKRGSGAVSEARKILIDGFQVTGEPALLDALSQMDLGRERPEDAISSLRGQLATHRHSLAARLALGRLYLRLEMLDEAAEQFERLYEESSRCLLAAAHLAEVEERRGHGARAAKLYREVLSRGHGGGPRAQCRACGAQLAQWESRCATCGAFGTVETDWGDTEAKSLKPASAPAPLYPASLR